MEIEIRNTPSPTKAPSTSVAALSTPNATPLYASESPTQAANGVHDSPKKHQNSLSNGVHHANNDVEMLDVSIDVGKVTQTPSNSELDPLSTKSPEKEITSGDKGDVNEDEEVGEEDDEETEDDDEDEEEDEDDEEEEDSASSGSFQSADEVEGGASRSAINGTTAASNGMTDNTTTNDTGTNAVDTNATASTSSEPFKKPEIPKKKRPKRRSPSFDPPVPAGPPARPTVRLQLTIAHTDEETYMTNVPDEIHKVLKEKDHPWAKWYESTLPEDDTEMAVAGPSNGVNLQELGGLAKLLHKYPDKASSGPSGGRKRRKFDEYDIGQYDVRDPFVDDTELEMDEPTHAAKPSADGFFVTQGDVELEEASEDTNEMQAMMQNQYSNNLGKRAPIPPGFGESTEDGGGGAGAVSLQMGPKPDNIAIINRLLSRFAVQLGLLSPAAVGNDSRESESQARQQTPSNSQNQERKVSTGAIAGAEGSRQSPIKVDDDTEGRVAPVFPATNAKYPTRSVPRRLEREFDMLRLKVSKESWLQKAKFPPDLREPLMQATKVAVGLDEYNDNFFNWLPHIFPYNRLTLHKYIKRQFLEIHTDIMRKLIDVNLEVLEKQVKEALPILQQEFDEAKANWTSSGNAQSNGIEGGVQGEAPPSESNQNGAAIKSNDMEVDADEGDKEGEEATSKEGEPIKRWRWSEVQREIIFTIVTIDDAIMELRNEKIQLEGSTEKLSTQNARKMIYKQIYDVWPEDGWTTTTAISREYGLYKRKVDRYTIQYHETQGRDIDSAIAL